MLRFNGLKNRVFSELLEASGILFLASVFANICNLLFWLYMVRRLEPSDYGILNALFSLLIILSLSATTIQTVVTKSVSQFFAKGEFSQTKCFLLHFGKRILLFAALFLLVFILLTPEISSFLKIQSSSLVVITGFILFFSIVTSLTMGVLQGGQRFLAMSINSIFGSAMKLLLSVILMVLGFNVMGALTGVGLSVVLALVLSIFEFPKEVLNVNASCVVDLKIDWVYKYSVPVFLSLFALMVLTNADVILVKHFFSPEDAGFYSVAQMVGKIIIFLPSVIGIVLFPKISEAFSQKKPTLPLLKNGLAMTGFLCILASIFCILYPGFVLKVLTSKQDIASIRLVPYFCVAMTFYALVGQFVSYNLATQQFRFTAYLLSATFLQVGLISLFHPNLSAVLYSLILNSILLFFAGWFEVLKDRV